jgi:hypothetical protein
MRAVMGKDFKLLPCAKDVCQECAVKHDPGQPHNAQSLYYHFKFHSQFSRAPTWKDALEHCAKPVREAWESELNKRGISF